MTRLELVTALLTGNAISIPMTDGYASIRGRVLGMLREDGSGDSWIVTIQQTTPYGYRTTKLYMRTRNGQYACRMIDSKRVAK